MNKSINDNYIKYKLFFITSAYAQLISKTLVKLFIKVNDYQIYFPEFIYHKNYNDHSNVVLINIERINNIVCDVIQLIRDKCNEIKS